MKSFTEYKKILSIMMLMIVAPSISMAQPANPGGDPYATPVNGGVAFVAAIAFLYGGYRMYQLARKSRVGNTNH